MLNQNVFAKHDPEPNEETLIKSMGGTIIDQRIEIMDSSGMNRTIVRRQDNNSKWNI